MSRGCGNDQELEKKVTTSDHKALSNRGKLRGVNRIWYVLRSEMHFKNLRTDRFYATEKMVWEVWYACNRMRAQSRTEDSTCSGTRVLTRSRTPLVFCCLVCVQEGSIRVDG